MPIGYVAPAPLHRRLERLRQLDHQRHALLGPRRAAGQDHGILRRHQHPGRFRHGRGVASRRARQRQLRDAQPRPVPGGILLEITVGDQNDRRHRHGHGDLVGAHGRFGKMRQRDRCVVPLDVVANHRRRVLNAMIPFHPRPAIIGVQGIAEHDVDGNPRNERVVNGYRGVLQPNRPVGHGHHRFAGHAEIAVGEGNRRFFVAAGQPLRPLVLAVGDERLLQPAETRPGVGGDVLKPERFEDIHHEIRPGVLNRQALANLHRHRLRFSRQRGSRRRRGTAPRRRSGGLLCAGPGDRSHQRHRARGRAGRRTFQKPSTVDRVLSRFRHGCFSFQWSGFRLRLNVLPHDRRLRER